MSAEQTEFVCPQCRKRTVVSLKEGSEETVVCPSCEVEMKQSTKTSAVAAAAANAPLESSVGGKKTATATKPRASRAKSATGTAVKEPKAPRASKKVVEPEPVVVIPDFGEFRCACCGFVQHVAPGAEKSGVLRCPTCFVKMDWIRA